MYVSKVAIFFNYYRRFIIPLLGMTGMIFVAFILDAHSQFTVNKKYYAKLYTQENTQSLLKVKDNVVPILAKDLSQQTPFGVEIKILKLKKDWALLYQKKLIKPDENGVFKINISLSSEATTLKILGVGPSGETQNQEIGISFPDFKNAKKELETATYKSLQLTFGIGASQLNYSENYTRFKQLNVTNQQIALTAKTSILYASLSSAFNYGGSLFMTSAVFQSSHPIPMRFLGANARIGYNLPFMNNPWTVGLMVGGYYTTTLVKNRMYGYQHIGGPQIFPTVKRTFQNGQAFSSYLKFSPISSGASFLKLNSRELASGINYSFPFWARKTGSLSLDWSSLNIHFGNASITNESLSFSFGIGF